MHLTAGSVPRKVKQACKCAGNVLNFHYWLWHVRQRTQHVLLKGKLCFSACVKCVSKPVVKDAIYLVFQKPLSKFLTEVTENQRHLMKLSLKTSSSYNQELLWCGAVDWHVNLENESLLFKLNAFLQIPQSVVSILPLLTEELYELSSGKHRLIERTWLTTVKEKSVDCTKTNGSGDLSAESLSSGSSGSHTPQRMCHFSSCYPNKETRSTRGPKQGNRSKRK